MTDLGRFEVLLELATPGPWFWVPNFGPTAIFSEKAPSREFVAEEVSATDTRLIVEARNQLPALIAELREARATIERVQAMTVINGRRRVGCFPISALRDALDGDK